MEGAAGVGFDLGAKGFGRVEFYFVAKAVPEFYGKRTGDDLRFEIEEITFDGDVLAVEGGTRADVGDGAKCFCVRRGLRVESDFGDVDAELREDFLGRLEIERGDDDARAAAVAGDDMALEGVGAAEKAAGESDIAIANGIADDGAGNGDAAENHGRNAFDGEVIAFAELAEKRNIAGVLVAEAEILADQDGLRAKRFDEDAADEIFGSEFGEVAVEAEYEGSVDAGGFEGGEALAKGEE